MKNDVMEVAFGSSLVLLKGVERGRTTPARFSGSSTGVKWNAGSLMRLAAAADLDDCLSVWH